MNAPVGPPVASLVEAHLVGRGTEDCVPAAHLTGQVDDRDDDHDVDEGVLDERDHRRRPESRGVGEGGEHREGDEQRQVARQLAVAPADAGHLEHGLDADELQRDVGHRRHEPGDGDGEREAAVAVAAAHEVGRRHVAVPVAHRPQPRHEDEDDRVEHDRVGHREEPGDGTEREHRGRHRDERVGGVEVAAEQEPGDPGAELAAAEPPLVEAVEVVPPLEPRGHEAEHGDHEEQRDQDAERDAVDVAGGRQRGRGAHESPFPRPRREASTSR